MRLAIIDDEEFTINSIKLYLEKKGKYDITPYTNPTQAINSVKAGTYDLILLDINMPQMTGIEFLEKLREHNKTQKVIMMTALSTQEKLIKCEKLNVSDYITKPFISLRDVENKILDVMGY